MAKVVLAAKNRVAKGSRAASRLRRAGRIPGTIYGRGKQAVSIDLDAKEFSNAVRSISESTIVDVQVDGESHEAFVKDTQRNVLTGSILHADFYEIERGKLLRARVRLFTKGSAIGVRGGGVLELPIRDIEVESLPKDLPERIVVDISSLDVNQAIHVSDLKLGEGVKLLTPLDETVALVKYMKEEVEETPAAEAAAATAEGEAAATADGKAAPAADGKAAPAADGKAAAESKGDSGKK
jgi:large subunit ribosomal protein L25